MSMTGNSSSGAFCEGPGRVMLSGFALGADGGFCIKYLFEDAVVDTRTKYVFAVLGTFAMAMVVELLRLLRTRVGSRHVGFARRLSDGALDGVVVLLYAVQMCAAYWLMLLVMLYEYVIFIAIVLGLATGMLVSRRLDRRCFPHAAAAPAAGGTPCCDGCECAAPPVGGSGGKKGKAAGAYYELHGNGNGNGNGEAVRGGGHCCTVPPPAAPRSATDAV